MFLCCRRLHHHIIPLRVLILILIPLRVLILMLVRLVIFLDLLVSLRYQVTQVDVSTCEHQNTLVKATPTFKRKATPFSIVSLASLYRYTAYGNQFTCSHTLFMAGILRISQLRHLLYFYLCLLCSNSFPFFVLFCLL